MIKFEHTEVLGWEHAIRGMRNPMNSWDRSDSGWQSLAPSQRDDYILISEENDYDFWIGPNDAKLMENLSKAGTDHRKFMRMIAVYVDITAPLYWWKEFDTYKIGTVANSCSTMHKIHAKEFTLEDFSTEHLIDDPLQAFSLCDTAGNFTGFDMSSKEIIQFLCNILNYYRKKYLETKDKKYWWQMIQLLPSSYNQRRTVMLNYEVLANIYKSRKDHKLDEWAEHKEIIPDIDSTSQAKYAKPYKEYVGFCDWIKTLPYSELITGKECEV